MKISTIYKQEALNRENGDGLMVETVPDEKNDTI